MYTNIFIEVHWLRFLWNIQPTSNPFHIFTCYLLSKIRLAPYLWVYWIIKKYFENVFRSSPILNGVTSLKMPSIVLSMVFSLVHFLINIHSDEWFIGTPLFRGSPLFRCRHCKIIFWHKISRTKRNTLHMQIANATVLLRRRKNAVLFHASLTHFTLLEMKWH